MVEFIGFIISLLALLYLFMTQNFMKNAQHRQAGTPDEDLLDQEDPMQELMKAIEKETRRRENPPASIPPASPYSRQKKESKKLPSQKHVERKQNKKFEQEIAQRRLKSPLEDKSVKSKSPLQEELSRHQASYVHYYDHVNKKLDFSQAKRVIHRLKDKRDLMIYQQILGKPRALSRKVYER